MSENKYSLKKKNLNYLLEENKGERIHILIQLHLLPSSAYVLYVGQGFSTSALLTLWSGKFFVSGSSRDYLVLCRMFHNVPGLYP